MAAALFGCQRDPPPPSSAGAASASAKVVPPGGSVVVASAPVSVSAAVPSASASGAVADAGTVGTIDPMRPEDWELGPGKWTFEPDGTLACECKSNSHVIWWKASQPKDFDAAVEVQFLGDESSAGILFRTQGQDFYNDMSFYQFEWYTRGTHHDKRLSLMRKNPYWVQIVTPLYPEAPYKKWIDFRVRAEKDHLEAFIDGERVFDKKDATFVRGGRLGLHVFQPRRTLFRKWRLTVL